MKTTIALLLIIGILTNLLKGADLILRSHQKQWVQSQFESLTLWLEYTKPLSWYKKLTSPKGRAVLLTLLALLLLYIWSPSLTTESFRILRLLPVISLTVSLIFLRRYIVRIADWLIGEQRYPYITKRAIIFLAVTTIVFVLFFLIIAMALRLMSASDPGTQKTIFITSIAFVVIIIMPFMALSAELLFLLVTLTCLALILESFEQMLKIVRGIAWRIIEYDKGAYAALTLIITIGLGVVLVMMKG